MMAFGREIADIDQARRLGIQPAVGVGRRPSAASSDPILDLHRWAGNRAVTGLLRRAVQRSVGWTDASTKGLAWNLDERAVGKVRRIPLEGLSEGMGANRTDKKAWKPVWNAAKKEWDSVLEPTQIADLSSESAEGKAIVLVPAVLDATQGIEVLVFLHGHTEDAGRPYAGWRTLDTTPPTKGLERPLIDRLKRLRQGLPAAELPPGSALDVAPVRDVALDQAEQQLEESGQKQLVIVLPQGGPHSQFGKEGDANFDAGPYVAKIVSRLQTEKRWKDGKGDPAKAAPTVTRINMAGHSGAGAALSRMAGGKKPSSALTGDLVIYDAINGPGQLNAFVAWAEQRLDEDLAVLTGTATDDKKLEYLQGAQKLRGYTTSAYIDAYIALDNAIARWFARNKKKLGAWAPCLRANYSLEYVGVSHEELMRGSLAGSKRPAGTGTILDAVKGLHPARMTSTAACPPMPQSLADRYQAIISAKP